MAQYPKIQLKFVQIPTSGRLLNLYIGGLAISLTSTLNSPPGFKQYLIGNTLASCAENLDDAMRANYGMPFTFSSGSLPGFELVEITCNSYDLGDWTYSIENLLDFEVTVTPVEAPADFGITGLIYATSNGDRCNYVRLTPTLVNATPPFEGRSYYNGSFQESKNTNDQNDIYFYYPRNTAGLRKIEIKSGSARADIIVPIIQQIIDVDVSITYSQYAATVSLLYTLSNGEPCAPFQFSIDNVNFTASNSFEINVSGDYVGYVVDNYGCKKSVAFSVDLEGRKGAPYFDIEITNPLRLVDQNITGIKNISNQLSADYDIPNVEDRFFRQPFKIGDIIRTQFKSNYSDHEVRVYNCGNLIETITPILKIENTNRLDKRDVVIRTGAPNKTNVAFPQGNIYDPITNDVIDTYFQFDGRLPSFVRVGTLLTFNDPALSGTFEVEEIIFDERLQSWVAVITANRLGAGSGAAVEVLSTYNLEEYNIYEFELTYPEGQYHIEIVATDGNALYADVLWESEPFFFSDDIDVVTIDYTSNVNQSLIDYRTDIEFRLCVPGRFAKYQPTAESETFKDDLGNLYLQKNTYNRMWEVETSLIPWWIAEKLIVASQHKILKIDGLSVVNSETPEVTDRLGERNPFYQVVGMYQENIDISVTDETGIISRARGILGGNENQVIGI